MMSNLNVGSAPAPALYRLFIIFTENKSDRNNDKTKLNFSYLRYILSGSFVFGMICIENLAQFCNDVATPGVLSSKEKSMTKDRLAKATRAQWETMEPP